MVKLVTNTVFSKLALFFVSNGLVRNIIFYRQYTLFMKKKKFSSVNSERVKKGKNRNSVICKQLFYDGLWTGLQHACIFHLFRMFSVIPLHLLLSDNSNISLEMLFQCEWRVHINFHISFEVQHF